MKMQTDHMDKVPDISDSFTKAENLIAKFLLRGMSNNDIANEAFITPKTVKFHLTNMYKKSGVVSRLEFMAKWLPKHERAQAPIRKAEADAAAEASALTDGKLPFSEEIQHKLT